jgi:hypothetical protein
MQSTAVTTWTRQRLPFNTVQGKAVNAVVAYAPWVRRQLDRLDPRPPSTFDAMPEVRLVLDDHLDVQREPSLAIRSCYGRHFPWLQFLNRAWAQTAVPRIFPADEQYVQYRRAAWDTYLLFWSAYDDGLTLLEPEYLRAIRELPTAEQTKKRAHTPRRHHAEHLMAYCWRGKLAIDSQLVTEFFRLLRTIYEGTPLTPWGAGWRVDPRQRQLTTLSWRDYAICGSGAGESRRTLGT